jgi:CheY-like chemotaxis protein
LGPVAGSPNTQHPTPNTLHPTPTAILTVADTGIGIPPELLPRLFEPFVQADRSLERSQGGLGLGLALVKGIVDLHGGCVAARSEGAGRGATFTIELPLADVNGWLLERDDKAGDAPALDPGMLVGQSLASAHEPASTRVLIIEDNADAAETLQALLEIFGYRVEVASSGPAGVEMAQRARPDIVLCDLGLPGMDGYAVAATLRADPATASARLIAVSGYGQDEDRRRSAAAGFDAHLVKPVEAELLQPLLDGAR